jgi:hypothetical protein
MDQDVTVLFEYSKSDDGLDREVFFYTEPSPKTYVPTKVKYQQGWTALLQAIRAPSHLGIEHLILRFII